MNLHEPHQEITHAGYFWREADAGDCETRRTYLVHALEELITTPALEAPVVIVLLRTTDDKGTVASRATAEELASAQLDLSVAGSAIWLRDDVPISLLVKVPGPTIRG